MAYSKRAKRFYDDIDSHYRLRADEQLLLEEICDEITLIDSQAVKLAETATPNARVLEVMLRHRGLLSRLIRQLGLKDTNGAAVENKTSGNARKAAAARWGNRG